MNSMKKVEFISLLNVQVENHESLMVPLGISELIGLHEVNGSAKVAILVKDGNGHEYMVSSVMFSGAIETMCFMVYEEDGGYVSDYSEVGSCKGFLRFKDCLDSAGLSIASEDEIFEAIKAHDDYPEFQVFMRDNFIDPF